MEPLIFTSPYKQEYVETVCRVSNDGQLIFLGISSVSKPTPPEEWEEICQRYEAKKKVLMSNTGPL